MDEFFRTVLGKPALCFGSMASRPEPQLDSVKALNDLGNVTDKSVVGLEGRCEAGDPQSCLVAGLLVMEGQGAMQDFRRAAKLLDSACQRGVSKACFSLGRLNDGVRAMDGSSLPVDSVQAAKLYRAACNGGVGEGCYNVAQMLDQGRIAGGESERKLHGRVAKFFALACKQNVGRGCVNLGAMKYEGTQISKDQTGALQLFRKGCELGEGVACGHAGSMMAAGEGVKSADAAAGAELFYEGCRLGHARSCLSQAKMLSAVAVDAVENKSATSEHALHAKARAVMFYRRACELGDPQGCRIYRKSPEGLKQIDTRAGDETLWLNVEAQKPQAKSS